MHVPRHISPLTTDEDSFVPGMGQNGGDAQNSRDRMIVPDRIIVAGGNETIADKPPPREITLDMQSFAPSRYGHNSSLETPPDKLTLHNRAFPTIDEADYYRQHQLPILDDQKVPRQPMEERKGVEGQIAPKEINHSSDSLPSTAAMSVLSPTEELTLLRNQVRKLTTRLQKLEEETQDTSRHVSVIEMLGGILVVVLIAKSFLSRA